MSRRNYRRPEAKPPEAAGRRSLPEWREVYGVAKSTFYGGHLLVGMKSGGGHLVGGPVGRSRTLPSRRGADR